MFQSLDLFRTAGAMASRAGAQTALVARNIANADTPGYRATALPSFAESMGRDMTLRRTRPGHLGAAELTSRARPVGNEPAPNGNDVSIEEQMVLAVGAERAHSRALAIYRHGLTILRTSLGR